LLLLIPSVKLRTKSKKKKKAKDGSRHEPESP
jgi:hypothetical protein